MARAYFWSSPVTGSDTAGLRTMGAELKAALETAGLSRSTDTGQIDWSTITAPAANAVIGYEIWPILNGALRMKIVWTMPASALSTTIPKNTITIGTGSDGAGNLTGIIYTGGGSINALTAAAGNFPSYASNPAKNDAFALVYKVAAGTSGGVTPSALIAIAVEKIVDAAGDADGTGYVITQNDVGGGASRASALSKAVYVTATGYTRTSALCCLVPMALTDSSVGTDKQPFEHRVATPRVRLTIGVCTVIASEAIANTTFNAALVGDPVTAKRGYVSVAYGFGGSHAGGTSGTYSTAIIWEP